MVLEQSKSHLSPYPAQQGRGAIPDFWSQEYRDSTIPTLHLEEFLLRRSSTSLFHCFKLHCFSSYLQVPIAEAKTWVNTDKNSSSLSLLSPHSWNIQSACWEYWDPYSPCPRTWSDNCSTTGELKWPQAAQLSLPASSSQLLKQESHSKRILSVSQFSVLGP